MLKNKSSRTGEIGTAIMLGGLILVSILAFASGSSKKTSQSSAQIATKSKIQLAKEECQKTKYVWWCFDSCLSDEAVEKYMTDNCGGTKTDEQEISACKEQWKKARAQEVEAFLDNKKVTYKKPYVCQDIKNPEVTSAERVTETPEPTKCESNDDCSADQYCPAPLGEKSCAILPTCFYAVYPCPTGSDLSCENFKCVKNPSPATPSLEPTTKATSPAEISPTLTNTPIPTPTVDLCKDYVTTCQRQNRQSSNTNTIYAKYINITPLNYTQYGTQCANGILSGETDINKICPTIAAPSTPIVANTPTTAPTPTLTKDCLSAQTCCIDYSQKNVDKCDPKSGGCVYWRQAYWNVSRVETYKEDCYDIYPLIKGTRTIRVTAQSQDNAYSCSFSIIDNNTVIPCSKKGECDKSKNCQITQNQYSVNVAQNNFNRNFFIDPSILDRYRKATIIYDVAIKNKSTLCKFDLKANSFTSDSNKNDCIYDKSNNKIIISINDLSKQDIKDNIYPCRNAYCLYVDIAVSGNFVDLNGGEDNKFFYYGQKEGTNNTFELTNQ